jgi:cysteine-rich repeat protein
VYFFKICHNRGEFKNIMLSKFLASRIRAFSFGLAISLVVAFCVFGSIYLAVPALAAISQEGSGAIEFDTSSTNFQLKGMVGEPGVGTSTSTNFIINHGMWWASPGGGAVCGNGVRELGEVCDEGALNGQSCHCNSFCTGTVPGSCGGGAVCGNGIQEIGENCDDGVLNGTPNHCNSSCSGTTGSVCGNGTPEAGEGCDDGNLINTDSCLSTCHLPTCGDGYVWSGQEICDDGNTSNTDSCLNTCRLPTCGDGYV